MSTRRSARIVGVLYIVGTVAGILSAVSVTLILEDPDVLTAAAEQSHRVIVGALFVMIMGVSLAFIPVVMFPILKAQNEALALGYVVFRSGLEAITYLAIATSWLLLVPIGQEYVAAAPDASSVEALGTVLLAAESSLSATLAIVFSIGALLFNYLLYRSEIVPRWLALWGLLAAIPYFASGPLLMFDVVGQTSAALIASNLPMAIQEMVLAFWLVVRGFDETAIDSLTAEETAFDSLATEEAGA